MDEKEELKIDYLEEDEDDDEDIEIPIPWGTKHFKLVSFLLLVFGAVFILSGIASLLLLIGLLNMEYKLIVYILCFISLILTVIFKGIRTCALNAYTLEHGI